MTARNIPEIKKFIGSYVEKIIIYNEHVEVIFKLDTAGISRDGTGIDAFVATVAMAGLCFFRDKCNGSKNPQPRAVVDLHGGGEGSRTVVPSVLTGFRISSIVLRSVISCGFQAPVYVN